MPLAANNASTAGRTCTHAHRLRGKVRARSNDRGMVMLGLLVALIVAALLVGGSLSLMRRLPQAENRIGTAEYIDEVRRAMFTQLFVYGSLPPADTDADGLPNAPSQPSPALADTTEGTLPFITFGVKPRDAWDRVVKYEVHPGLVSTRPTLEQRKKDSCLSLKAGLTGAPQVWDGGAVFTVAAVLVSGGPRDADGDGSVFDAVAGKGSNAMGTPYLRHVLYPDDGEPTFDDLTAFILPGVLTNPMTLLGWLKAKDTRFDWSNTCEYPHCHNAFTDWGETGLNCGGPDCDPCP